MNNIWNDIENWLLDNPESELHDYLRPPALLSDINRVESEIGIVFPDDVRSSFLRHDGADSFDGSLFYGWLLPLNEVIKTNLELTNVAKDMGYPSDGIKTLGPVKPLFWQSKWIPLVGQDGGSFICVDLDPPTQGTVGQIIEVYWSAGTVKVLANSFTGYLSLLLDSEEI